MSPDTHKHERFCEACGDCLYCYGEDPCHRSPDGKHQEPSDEPEAP